MGTQQALGITRLNPCPELGLVHPAGLFRKSLSRQRESSTFVPETHQATVLQMLLPTHFYLCPG